MTWFKVDDSFSEHEKLEQLESDPHRFMAAVSVWTLMGSDCARRMTDGRVSRARLSKVMAPLGSHAELAAQALVDCGLWDATPSGWVFHDWSDYQPTRAEVEDARRHKTDRQRRWREGRSEREPTSGQQPGHGTVAKDRTSVTAVVRSETSLGEASDAQSDSLQSGSSSPRCAEPVDAAGDRLQDGAALRGAPPSPLDPARAAPDHSRSLDVHVRDGDVSDFTAARMSRLFQARYLAARGVDPSMGGRNLGDFHARVLATSHASKRDPEQLFCELLDRWLAGTLSEVDRRAPYACFASAWGALADRTGPPRDVRQGFLPPAPAEAFSGPELSPEEIFGIIDDHTAKANPCEI